MEFVNRTFPTHQSPPAGEYRTPIIILVGAVCLLAVVIVLLLFLLCRERKRNASPSGVKYQLSDHIYSNASFRGDVRGPQRDDDQTTVVQIQKEADLIGNDPFVPTAESVSYQTASSDDRPNTWNPRNVYEVDHEMAPEQYLKDAAHEMATAGNDFDMDGNSGDIGPRKMSNTYQVIPAMDTEYVDMSESFRRQKMQEAAGSHDEGLGLQTMEADYQIMRNYNRMVSIASLSDLDGTNEPPDTVTETTRTNTYMIYEQRSVETKYTGATEAEYTSMGNTLKVADPAESNDTDKKVKRYSSGTLQKAKSFDDLDNFDVGNRFTPDGTSLQTSQLGLAVSLNIEGNDRTGLNKNDKPALYGAIRKSRSSVDLDQIGVSEPSRFEPTVALGTQEYLVRPFRDLKCNEENGERTDSEPIYASVKRSKSSSDMDRISISINITVNDRLGVNDSINSQSGRSYDRGKASGHILTQSMVALQRPTYPPPAPGETLPRVRRPAYRPPSPPKGAAKRPAFTLEEISDLYAKINKKNVPS